VRAAPSQGDRQATSSKPGKSSRAVNRRAVARPPEVVSQCEVRRRVVNDPLAAIWRSKGRRGRTSACGCARSRFCAVLAGCGRPEAPEAHAKSGQARRTGRRRVSAATLIAAAAAPDRHKTGQRSSSTA